VDPTAVATTQEPPTAEPPARDPDAASPSTAGTTTPGATEPAIEWPLLSLSGIVGRGENGAAIISGRVLGVGETIDGVELIRIERQGVTLKYEGRTRFLKVGRQTD
jgi:hypothetical protein